ncbi:unnamed protein product [Candidula unifasciata]|uniref:Reelin domain-containing protein n=1 Tax=Candidula unifasciata TaxID=100452 RepID=A0A8S3ZH45_9EUPU|nr:unnamed protein product [Candidula unifasciata]
MNHAILFILTVCGTVFRGHYMVAGYPDGAPEGTCEIMYPGHHTKPEDPTSSLIAPQTGKPFYSIVVDKTKVNPGEEVQVTLQADEYYFEGFLIQVRDVTVQTSQGVARKYGTFTALSNDTKALCKNQALTHATHYHFNSTTMKWTAPNETIENVRFTATVVKGYKTFFLNVHSEVLNFSSPSPSVVPSLALILFLFCFMLYGHSF